MGTYEFVECTRLKLQVWIINEYEFIIVYNPDFVVTCP